MRTSTSEHLSRTQSGQTLFIRDQSPDQQIVQNLPTGVEKDVGQSAGTGRPLGFKRPWQLCVCVCVSVRACVLT